MHKEAVIDIRILTRIILIEGDPNNYLTYYKRGTVYLALGKAKFALLDLDRVLELKPDFTSARLQRGNVLLKQAQFEKAEADFRDVVSIFLFQSSNVFIHVLSVCYNFCFSLVAVSSRATEFRCLQCLI